MWFDGLQQLMQIVIATERHHNFEQRDVLNDADLCQTEFNVLESGL
jgi:hypothetical protein